MFSGEVPRIHEGATIFCVASGPSLLREDCEKLRGQVVVAVNDSYRYAPFASYLYAADCDWWDVHKGCPDFAGVKVTCNDDAAEKYGLSHIALVSGFSGFSRNPKLIHGGGNSGFQAVNLAILLGASRVVLLGYDMKSTPERTHFFGRHPRQLRDCVPPTKWAQAFDVAVRMTSDVEIINCSRDTAITAARVVDLDQLIKG
jgi:hypothetical protein